MGALVLLRERKLGHDIDYSYTAYNSSGAPGGDTYRHDVFADSEFDAQRTECDVYLECGYGPNPQAYYLDMGSEFAGGN